MCQAIYIFQFNALHTYSPHCTLPANALPPHCGIVDFLAGNSDTSYDIVFMDIYMTGMNGVDTVLKASPRNTFQLVFITVSHEHAIEAFGLDAAHYLVKPITENTVTEAMERCLSRMGTDCQKHIEIKTISGNVSIPTDQIIYIEVYNKT